MILYKYYSPKPYNFCSVCEGKLWFATNKLLNDPYDLYSGMSIVEIPFKRFNHLSNYITKTISNTKQSEVFLAVIKSYASCSFSINPIDRLMWAHYADGYKGFCVGYEVKEQNNFFHKVIYCDQQLPLYQQKNIRYLPDFNSHIDDIVNNWRKEFNNINDFDIDIKKGLSMDHIKRYSNEYLTSFLTHLMCIKAQEWCYEQEIRLIKQIDYKKVGELISIDNFSLIPKEIIIGNRFNQENLSIIQKIEKKYQIESKQLQLDEKRYYALNFK
ncbi:MAG: DUF2971 domain-containing protein [Paludibacteraceae bacterium]|nr:DUF2971 domain-containing protein [Paludibacteraceae bacterium]